MTTITGRLKLLSTEESHKAGNYDAETLLAASPQGEGRGRRCSDCLLADTLNEHHGPRLRQPDSREH
jgi:hypothetical protein